MTEFGCFELTVSLWFRSSFLAQGWSEGMRGKKTPISAIINAFRWEAHRFLWQAKELRTSKVQMEWVLFYPLSWTWIPAERLTASRKAESFLPRNVFFRLSMGQHCNRVAWGGKTSDFTFRINSSQVHRRRESRICTPSACKTAIYRFSSSVQVTQYRWVPVSAVSIIRG